MKLCKIILLVAVSCAFAGESVAQWRGLSSGYRGEVSPGVPGAIYPGAVQEEAVAYEAQTGYLGAADRITPDLQALADGFRCDPTKPEGAERIYEWILNNIDYTPYPGSTRGARMTWMEKAGNDFDTCSLLMALLYAGGYRDLSYKYAKVWIPLERPDGRDAAHWLGVDKAQVKYYLGLCGLLANPGDGADRDDAVLVHHVWVELGIAGQRYILNPSFKNYTSHDKFDFADALPSYSPTNLFDLVGTPGSTSSFTITPTTRSALFQGLGAYAVSLETALRAANPGKSALEIVGGVELEQKLLGGLPANVSGSAPDGWTIGGQGALENWAYGNIPSRYGVTIRIQPVMWFDGTDYADSDGLILPTADLEGGNLYLEYRAAGSYSRPIIVVNRSTGSQLHQPGNYIPSRYGYPRLYLEYGIPVLSSATERFTYWGNESGSVTRDYALDSSKYVIAYGFGRTLERLKYYLNSQSSLTAGYHEASHIIGLQYQSNRENLQRIMGYTVNAVNRTFVFGGIVRSDPSVDFMLSASIGCSTRPLGSVAENELFDSRVRLASAYFGSAMEHLCIEQAVPTTAVSTAKIAGGFGGSGITMYRANSLSEYQALKSGGSVVNIPQGVDAQIVDAFNSHHGRVLLPANFSTTYGSYQGSGYILTYDSGNTGAPNGVLMGISGGLSGGFAMTKITPQLKPITDNRNLSEEKVEKTPINAPKSKELDPVDAATGYFSTNFHGLSMGSGVAPWGLDFTVQYSEGYRTLGDVGTWGACTHNYDIKLRYRHPNDLDLDRAAISELAPLVLAARAVFDTYSYSGDARSWMVPGAIASWATDQLLHSRASVVMGTKTIEFTKRADGQFVPPAGIAATLTKNADGSHTFKARKGLEIHFRASDGRFTKIIDPNVSGSSQPELTATYTTWTIGSEQVTRLHQVTDAGGRTLTYNYYPSNGIINYVEDSTGRKASLYGFGVTTYPNANTEYRKYVYYYASSATLAPFYKEFINYDTISDSDGRTVVKSYYNKLGRVYKQETIVDGRTATSYLGVADGVTRVQDAEGNVRWLYFDRRGRNWAERNALGRISYTSYDGYNRVISTTTSGGRTTRFAYDENHEATSITNPADSISVITPESEDSISSSRKIKDFEENETEIKYNAQHRPDEIRLPGGIVSKIEYDGVGRIQRIHPAAYATGKWIEYSYEEAATYTKRITSTYPNGTTVIVNFDELGNMVQLIDRGGRKRTFTYDKSRRLKSVTLWSGTGYSATSPVGGTPLSDSIISSSDYNNLGDVVGETNPVGGYTAFDYDWSGNLLSVTDPDLITRLDFGYYLNGTLGTTVGLFDQKTTFQYYANDQVKSITDALNRITNYKYTDDGQLEEVKSPKQNISDAIYDPIGAAETIGDAYGNEITPGHDKDGRPTSLENRRNNTFTTAYDFTNRKVTSKTPLEKTGVTETNARGLVYKVTTPSNRIIENTSFDDEGRVLTQTIKDSQDTLLTSTTYAYLANGLLDTVTEGVKTTKRYYDDFYRLWKYEDGEGNTIEYHYDKAGKLTELIYPDNKTVTYAYDDKTQLLKSVTDWAIIPRVTSFTYDLAGRLQTMTRPNGTVRTYFYDAANQVRMIEERKSDGTLIWLNALKYDLDGNPNWILSDSDVPSWTKPDDAATYDADNRLETWKTYTVTHDDEGNMTYGPRPDGSMGSYTYDCYNRLQTAGSVTSRYSPDSLRVEAAGAKFTVDPNAALSRVLVRDAGGTDVTRYVYSPGGVLLYQIDAADNCTYYHADHLGSTIALTNTSGNVTGSVSYSSYGTITSSSGTLNTPFLYHGSLGCMTDTNGLVYMRARFYNPRLMRFVNADPIGFAGGMNWYAFCGGNPMAYTDPLGLDHKKAEPKKESWFERLFSGYGEIAISNAHTEVEGGKQIVEKVMFYGGLWYDIQIEKIMAAEIRANPRAAYDPLLRSKAQMQFEAITLVGGEVFAIPRVGNPGELGAGSIYYRKALNRYAIRFHHPWPMYLGGRMQQILEAMPKYLHDLFHSGLDKVLPRQASARFYDALAPAEKAAALEKLGDYTRKFDLEHGTHLYDAMLREMAESAPDLVL